MTHLAIEAIIRSLPPRWRVESFRRVALERGARNSDLADQALSLSSAGLLYDRNDETDRQFASEQSSRNAWVVHPGDLVVNPMWLFGGAIGVSDRKGAVSPDYRVYSLSPHLHPRYIHHLLRSSPYRDQYRLYMRAETTFDRRVTKDDFNDMPVVVPPLAVQVSIAEFLDAETARIDALVAARQRQAGLLMERRRSLVDGLAVPAALGGGADADQPWPVVEIKRAASFFSDGDWIESPYVTDEGIRLIQTGNVGEGEYREQGFRYITNETFRALGCTEVLPGDILISRLAGPVGCACLAPDLGTRMVVSVDVVIMRPVADLHPAFAVAYLSSSRHLALAELLARGTTMQRLSRSQVGDMPMPLPPLDLQRRIVADIDRELADQKALSAALNDQIARLLERRQTLVNTAVTGRLEIGGVAA